MVALVLSATEVSVLFTKMAIKYFLSTHLCVDEHINFFVGVLHTLVHTFRKLRHTSSELCQSVENHTKTVDHSVCEGGRRAYEFTQSFGLFWQDFLHMLHAGLKCGLPVE